MVDHEPTPRRERTRELIMDAAFDLFADRGVNGSTVVQICERAGFTRGAFYSNFSTKEELCLALLRREAGRHLDALRSAAGTLQQPSDHPLSHQERMRAALRLFLTASAQNPTGLLVRMEMQLHALRVPSFRRPLLLVEAELVRSIAAIMEPVVASLGLPLAVPARRLVRQLYATYDREAAAAMMCGRDLASDATADALLSVFADC